MPNTSAGKIFEEEIYEKLSIPNDWINLTPYIPLASPKSSGQKYTHKLFSSQFKEKFNLDTTTILSKKIEPDFVFYNPALKKVVVLEAKMQGSNGSVDEKLQTGGKKLKRLRKLFSAAAQVPPENISYSYLLKRQDFDKPQYRDTFEDIHEDGCEYYFVDEDFSLKIA
jgi:hypothetical protein